MAWPTANTAFLRDPDGIYKHDGFGHDQQQDAGLRAACFRQIPHSGIDLTGRGPIYSIAGGKVAASEYTKGAGYALIEDVTVPGFGRVFPVYFHAAAPMTPAGATTKAGDHIGVIGDTGTGTSKGAYHLHFSVATSLKAALNLIRVGTRPRYKGETVAQWATAHGLIDPLPLIRAVKDSVPVDKPATDNSDADQASPISTIGDLMANLPTRFGIKENGGVHILWPKAGGGLARVNVNGSENEAISVLEAAKPGVLPELTRVQAKALDELIDRANRIK